MEETTRNRVTVVCVAFLLIFIFLRVVSCGVSPSPEPGPTPTPTADCGGLDVGDTKVETCAGGTIVSECKDTGLVVTSNTCTVAIPGKKDCNTVTTFDELAPVIALNCVGCHRGMDTFQGASDDITNMLTRIKIKASLPGHMPAGKGDLAARDIALFDSWVADGKLAANDCQGTVVTPPTRDFYDFAWVEGKIIEDVTRLNINDQPNARYLIAVDLLNMGRTEDLAVAKAAASKSTNSVSLERDLYPVAEVAPGIYRIDVDELGIDADGWKLVENASQLQFESKTSRGQALKAITKTRLPWMFVQDFNDVALRNAAVYYKLTKAPATLQLLTKQLGVDFAGDLLNFDAALVGFNGSPLSPAANRLMSRHDSNDGYFWATYDTGPIVSNQQNLFKNPLLVEAGGRANLKFAAGEQLYSLPNGLMASFLANAAGVRLNEADPNVVHDFTSNPSSPIIKNAVSCFRCHNGGLLHATDKVRAAIPNANIGAADTQKALSLFKPQATIDRLFNQDNARFAKAMAEIGVDPAQPDPISRVSDRFLGDLGLEDVASLLFLTPDELRTCINLSDKGRQEASQVLTGGTISHDQLVQVVKNLVKDCQIFEDPQG